MLPEPREGLAARVSELETRLEEANDTIRAFSSGEIDAIVAASPDGDRVYTLKGADETYRVMVQKMAEGALTLTPDGLILFANDQFATMIGCPLERIIGARLQEFVAPDGGDLAVVSALLAGTTGTKAEVRLSPDGTTFVPVYLSIQKVNLDGADSYCLIVTNLSAQKRYDEKDAVMEAVPVGVFISRDTGCVTIVGNTMACDLLRVSPGANLSSSATGRDTIRNWREVKEGVEIPAGELPMQVAARTGQPVQDYEMDIEFDDGSSRCWLGNAVPLFDELKRPRGAVGAFVDITDRKRAEEKLGAANAELRNFAHAFAHGLQDPLAAVLKLNRLLQEKHGTRLGDEASQYVIGSIENAVRMENLLRGLLRYWEVTERSEESLSPVNCNRACAQALSNLEESIRATGAVVTSDSLPTVVADEVMLIQVFQNLIGNSIRYSTDAVPAVHISAVRAGDRWLFTVRDNGIGVERMDAERIFGMFSSLQGESASGSGIGLALCRKVVERHGGRIWVDSQAGHGSSFRFTLPIYLESVAPVRAAAIGA